MTPQVTEPKLPSSAGGSPMEVWVGRGAPQGWRHTKHQIRKVPLDLNPLGVHH